MPSQRITASVLANTAVSAGIYGGSSNSATITVDAQGRITSASNAAISSSPIATMNVLTTGTSATWTIPAGITKVRVTVVGGGGNGAGSAGGGGGGGGAAIKILTGLTPGNTLLYTVGGAGATSQVASGTQTITTISATGGSAGTSGAAGGAGGIGSNGDLNFAGGGGGSGVNTSLDEPRVGGHGGDSFFGGGGYGTQNVGSGVAGRAYGGGGSGSYTSGSSGAAGVVIFEY
jgi:hypothetical protein